jgi:uncharacterized membrane protein
LKSPRPEHFRHHGRFYLAFLGGVVVGGAAFGVDPGVRVALGGNAFFALYLASTALIGRRLTVADLRRKASFEDEGIGLIAVITLAAIALSLGSLAIILSEANAPRWRLIPAVANVPLGWATLHTVMAFHYAHLFYSEDTETKRTPHDRGGLEFPKTKEPSVLDFVYYAFVIGMTAQVSDVQTTSQEMRRATTVHGVISFFFNTVILAFAVNVVTRG